MSLMTLMSRSEQNSRHSRGSTENTGPLTLLPVPREHSRAPREHVHALQLPVTPLQPHAEERREAAHLEAWNHALPTSAMFKKHSVNMDGPSRPSELADRPSTESKDPSLRSG